MEAARSSKTLVPLYRTTGASHILEGKILTVKILFHFTKSRAQ